MSRAPRIVIIGGGIGGLASALALQRHGAEIVVCEQSPALKEIGTGLNLTPNALVAQDAVPLSRLPLTVLMT
jgi:2-polyprenyl-6-methoxyphenol hydroxylase-like FAD-dependent oxidoreductase